MSRSRSPPMTAPANLSGTSVHLGWYSADMGISVPARSDGSVADQAASGPISLQSRYWLVSQWRQRLPPPPYISSALSVTIHEFHRSKRLPPVSADDKFTGRRVSVLMSSATFRR